MVFGVRSCSKTRYVAVYFLRFLDFWHDFGSFNCMECADELSFRKVMFMRKELGSRQQGIVCFGPWVSQFYPFGKRALVGRKVRGLRYKSMVAFSTTDTRFFSPHFYASIQPYEKASMCVWAGVPTDSANIAGRNLALANKAVIPTLGWRWLLVLSALPSFLLLLFYGMTPESPRYLCAKGKTLDALHVMEKIARENRRELPPGVLVSDHKMEREEDPNTSEDTHLISMSKDELSVGKMMKPKMGGIHAVSILLSQKFVKSTLLVWVAFFGNAFSYYGIVLLTSELSIGNTKCRSTKEFQSINSKDSSLYIDVFITSLAEVPGLILSALIVDKLGRKLSMSAMFFLSSIFLFPLIFHQSELVTTALLVGTRICITGSFNIVYVYAPEIYPTSVRTTGVGIASSVGRLGGITCPLVAVGLVAGCHQSFAVLLFEFVVLLSGIAVLLLPLETKGRELDDSAY